MAWISIIDLLQILGKCSSEVTCSEPGTILTCKHLDLIELQEEINKYVAELS